MERAKRFYKPMMHYLGYRVSEDTAQDLGFATDDDKATGIVIHPARSDGRGRTLHRYSPGLHHLAFRVSSREEVDGLHTLLKEMGATILDPPARLLQGIEKARLAAGPKRLPDESMSQGAGFSGASVR